MKLVFLLLSFCLTALASLFSTTESQPATLVSTRIISESPSWIEDNKWKSPTSYQRLERQITSTPCCVSQFPGRVDCFVRGEDASIRHWWKEGGEYVQGGDDDDCDGYKCVYTGDYSEELENLGGLAVEDIGCVSRGKGYLDVLVVGDDHSLQVKTHDGEWQDWKTIKRRIMEAPTCVARTSSVLNCAVRGDRNTALQFGAVDGAWSPYTNRKGVLTYPPGVSRRSDEIIDYWHVGNGHLYHAQWDGKWSGWNDLGKEYKGRPVAVSWDENRIDVFVLSLGNRLMHLAFDESQWGEWEDLGGEFIDMPDCVAVDVGRIFCLGFGETSKAYSIEYADGGWMEWNRRTNGFFLGSPSCVVSNADEVSCYGRTFFHGFTELVFKID